MNTIQLDSFLGENRTETQKCLRIYFQEPESPLDFFVCLFVLKTFFFSPFFPSFFFFLLSSTL